MCKPEWWECLHTKPYYYYYYPSTLYVVTVETWRLLLYWHYTCIVVPMVSVEVQMCLYLYYIVVLVPGSSLHSDHGNLNYLCLYTSMRLNSVLCHLLPSGGIQWNAVFGLVMSPAMWWSMELQCGNVTGLRLIKYIQDMWLSCLHYSCMQCIEPIHMFCNKFLGLNYCILMKGLESLSVSHLSLHLISNFSIPRIISL